MLFDEERKYYVYVWFYKESGKIFYVGKGTKYRYRSRKRDNKKLVEIISNCDCDSRIVKGNLDEKEAFELEKEMIEFYRQNGHPLINIQDGGHLPPSSIGKHRTDETREKMSRSMKQYHARHPEIAEEQSRKMKEFLQTQKGKEFQKKSIESRNNDEFKQSQSERCRKANNTDEYKKRQSEIVKKMWESEEYVDAHKGANNGRAQSVRQYDMQHNFIAEYPTMTDAEKRTGVSVSKISLVAKKKRKTAGGYIWEYVDEKKFKIHKERTSRYDVSKDKTAIHILQFSKNGDFIAEYRSIAEAVRINGFKERTNIISNLKERTKSAYGYVWKYKQGNTVPSQQEGHS